MVAIFVLPVRYLLQTAFFIPTRFPNGVGSAGMPAAKHAALSLSANMISGTSFMPRSVAQIACTGVDRRSTVVYGSRL